MKGLRIIDLSYPIADDMLVYPEMERPVMQWLGKAPYVSFVAEHEILREMAQAGFEAREYWTHGRANSLFLIACRV